MRQTCIARTACQQLPILQPSVEKSSSTHSDHCGDRTACSPKKIIRRQPNALRTFTGFFSTYRRNSHNSCIKPNSKEHRHDHNDVASSAKPLWRNDRHLATRARHHHSPGSGCVGGALTEWQPQKNAHRVHACHKCPLSASRRGSDHGV